MNAFTHIVEEIGKTVQADFSLNYGTKAPEDNVELIPQHVEDGHRREYAGG